MRTMVVLETTEPLWSTISMSINMDHTNILVFFCKRDCVIAAEYDWYGIDIKYLFYLISHSSQRFDHVTWRYIYVTIVDCPENSKWIHTCFDVKMFIRWGGDSRSGTNCPRTIPCARTDGCTIIKWLTNNLYILFNFI